MAFEHNGERPAHTAKVSKIGAHYEYNFQPSIPVSSPFPAKVFNIMVSKIIPKGGGFNQQLVIGGQPVMGMTIPSSISRDVVEELFAAMREFGIDIQMTNETYPRPQATVDTTRKTYGYVITCNVLDPTVPVVSETYEQGPDGSRRIIDKTIHRPGGR